MDDVPVVEVGIPPRAGRSGPLDNRSRIRGLIALVLAFVLVAAVSGLSSRPLAGSAAPAPLPLPPAVGSCLNVDLTPQGPRPVFVPCDQLHRAEVIRAWPAPSAAPTGGVQVERPGPFPVLNYGVIDNRTCRQEAAAYVGPIFEPAVVGWHTVTPSVVSGLVGAPFDERVGDDGWSACLVFDGAGRSFEGSVKDMTRTVGGAWPDVFGVCGDEAPIRTTGACTAAHRVELLGVWQWYRLLPESPEFYTEVSAEALAAGCLALAAEVIGTDDPTFGGRLIVHSDSLWFSNEGDASVYFTGADGSAYSAPPPPDCWVQAAPGTTLTGSVRGLGDRPLPVG